MALGEVYGASCAHCHYLGRREEHIHQEDCWICRIICLGCRGPFFPKALY